MHAFFLTARPPRSDLEQPRLRLLVSRASAGVTRTTRTGRLLNLGPALLILSRAPGGSHGGRLMGGSTRSLSSVVRLAVLDDPAAELVRVEATGAADLVAGQLPCGG